MNSTRLSLIAMAVAIILFPTSLSGCSNLQASELPSRPRSCQLGEQMICTGGTASRIKNLADRYRTCRCGILGDYTR